MTYLETDTGQFINGANVIAIDFKAQNEVAGMLQKSKTYLRTAAAHTFTVTGAKSAAQVIGALESGEGLVLLEDLETTDYS